MGLHARYTRLLGTNQSISLKKIEKEEKVLRKLTHAFNGMMRALFEQSSSEFKVTLLEENRVQKFIQEHSKVLDSSFQNVKMSKKMRIQLQESDYIFSGMKTFHELNEAFPKLIDENGNKKSFNTFLRDVKSIDETYNKHYLRSEYNFASASAEMAGRWEEFEKDGDNYYLQYRTAGDDKVREEHASLDGVTLPMSDDFWKTYMPPLGWNCRCTVVQVDKDKNKPTSHSHAMKLGDLAVTGKHAKMFKFNPGLTGKTFNDYNPYTIKSCLGCPVAKSKKSFAKGIPAKELCEACTFLRTCLNYRSHNPEDYKTRRKEIRDNFYKTKLF